MTIPPRLGEYAPLVTSATGSPTDSPEAAEGAVHEIIEAELARRAGIELEAV
jgi:hypothetical protein